MRSRCPWALFMLVAITAENAALVAQAGQATIAVDLQHERDRFRYDGPPLTLQQALDEAREKNPGLLALRAQAQVPRQRPAQVRALAPPMLETTIWQWPVNSLNPANTNMYMFLATQDFPGSGKRALRAAAATKEIAIADNDIDVRSREVFNAVKQAYAELFVARKAIQIHLDTVDVLRQFADVSQAKYETARISQQDVLKPVVELSRLHADIIGLDQQAKIAVAKLNTLLDRPVDSPVGPLAEPTERTFTRTIDELQRLAVEHQPELQGARLAVERAEAELAVVRREYKPDLSVQAGYMLLPNQTDGVLARLAITWPNAPWSRKGLDARVREVSAAVEVAKANQRTLESMLRFSVQEAYVRVKAAEERASLLRTTIVPQSRQTLDVSRVGYQTDRVDLLALLDNERVLLAAQLDYYRALAEFDQALADLERAVGTDISTDVLHGAARER